MTTELYFGGVDDHLENLQYLLRWVSQEHPTEQELVDWVQANTGGNSEEVIIGRLRLLEAIDVLTQTEEEFRTTNKADAFWRQNEPQAIYEGLETGVDGFREVVRAIAAGQRSFADIQEDLRREYPDHELPRGVVRKHLDWLKSLDLVEQTDGEYSIPSEDGQFEVGKTYSRWFIHDVLKGERYKGISKPSDHPFILLFTGDSGDDYGYDDEFLDDDTFLYTGEGTEGDMTMDGGNKAIRDHEQNGESLHLFESSDLPWIVTYLGEYRFLEVRETELDDENGEVREAFRFKLEPVGGTEIAIEGGSPASLPDNELFEKAKQSTPSGTTSGGTSSSGRSYPRSQYVREFALRMADGVCQGCNEEAPFENKQGQPFLEVHHLTRRSDGGADSPENVIALCPNCHRRVHEGKDGDEFNQELKQEVRERNQEFLATVE